LSLARRRLLGGLLAAVLVLASAGSAAAAAAPVPRSIAVRPDCGPVGTGPPPSGPPPPRSLTAAPPTYTIEVIGRGLPANSEADVVFNPGAAQQAFAGSIDGTGAEDDVIHPVTVPAGTYVVEVRPFTFSGETTVPLPGARTLFTVPCPPPPPTPSPSPTPPLRISPPPRVLNPTLTLTPPVGSPGTIVTARGADFPASVPVQLSWSQGIGGTTSAPITTDATGAFTTRVLVLPHDALGPRVLTAVSVTPPNSSLFGFASAAFLVVAGEVQPNDFSWRR
jgi:hypothetical protein